MAIPHKLTFHFLLAIPIEIKPIALNKKTESPTGADKGYVSA